LIPGLQIDGYFPDGSKTNCYNNEDGFPCHDSQFVIRLPEKADWNGKLVVTGAPGVRKQYALDFIISDFVLSKGYAFASTDKGNTGTGFYDEGSEPGGSVAEWHRRVEQLTRAAKTTLERRYGKRPEFTYMTGISNGGYLTCYAIENNPELYDGSVDWEGVLWRRNGPNLFTHLPQALRHYPECKSSAPEYDRHACELMRRAGYPAGSEFLWEEHYLTYWDLTQRIYREEFDPGYDGEQKAGYPFCQEDGNPETRCDAEYRYAKRPDRVKDAVEKVSLTGNIGKPMLTLHGTYDVLLPMRLHSNSYRALIENAGKGGMHRYYKIENGNHVDSYFDRYRKEPTYVRPILPCYWAAFGELEEWVENKGEDPQPPGNRTVPHPTPEGTVKDANSCRISQEATYSAPVALSRRWPVTAFDQGYVFRKLESADIGPGPVDRSHTEGGPTPVIPVRLRIVAARNPHSSQRKFAGLTLMPLRSASRATGGTASHRNPSTAPRTAPGPTGAAAPTAALLLPGRGGPHQRL
jgi:pimeloyl-ACP methyl ester carboxylesterase